MVRRLIISLASALALLVSNACAEIYSWTDQDGTVHFTEDQGQIPARFRKKVQQRESAATPSPQELPSPETKGPAAVKIEAADTYGGKTYAEWSDELARKEAAMKEVRKSADELRDLLERRRGNERNRLVAQYRQLADQLKQLKADYFKTVENARKAGLTVNIMEDMDVPVAEKSIR